MSLLLPFITISILLYVGHYLRLHIPLFQKLYLPSPLIGGIVGLTLYQTLTACSITSFESFFTGLVVLPAFLINIVFACLFLGVKLPSFSTVIKKSIPQLSYGQIVAWGQYMVGLGLFIFIISKMWNLPAMFGAVIEIGFEGGHGTASGLAPTFEAMQWPQGKDFALASATVGIISAVICGIVLINWAHRKGYTHRSLQIENIPEDETIGIIPIDQRPVAGYLSIHTDSLDAMSYHVAIVGIAVAIGYGIKELLVHCALLFFPFLSHSTYTTLITIIKSFPLFPLCMIGGLVVQLFAQHFDKHDTIDIGLVRRIQNVALDILIVSAVTMIQVVIVIQGIVPFLIMVAGGILWNIFCLLVLAKNLLPDSWFERAIAELGQSMGVTATGLMLLRIVDPDYKTPALEAFAYKQLLHEPFMGGGIITSMFIPLLGIGGITMAYKLWVISVMVIICWLFILLLLKKKICHTDV
ncbi:MAG: sodium:glutamate symporter [Spirochaetes bacterium]|nr:sodium:glutamate symporter [Spirochaetota bacterium]